MSEFLTWYFIIGAIVFVAMLIVDRSRAMNLLFAPLLWPVATVIVVRWWWLNLKVKDMIYCGWCGLGKETGGLTHDDMIKHVLTDCKGHPLREKIDGLERENNRIKSYLASYVPDEDKSYVHILETENNRMDEALYRVASWADAYPLEIFPEPDFKRVRELLAAGGIPIDFVSASNMRHVVTQVAKIAREGLKVE